MEVKGVGNLKMLQDPKLFRITTSPTLKVKEKL